MKKAVLLILSHAAVALLAFAAGIYTLPILIAPPAPTEQEILAMADKGFESTFRRGLKGSDALHWGEGRVTVGSSAVTLLGRLAPGPDYRLYLAPAFVETEAEFEAVKSRSVQIGPVRTFENFVVPVPAGVDVAQFNTVVVWCETFKEFITAAQYRGNQP